MGSLRASRPPLWVEQVILVDRIRVVQLLVDREWDMRPLAARM